ncbi:sugar-binding domain-containing protein [Jonesiaceae bacterium BS-20]|uniref:Sugar-binding domain-containing protein n=1 Tax=Jonesiaceae bacterium BS-20 TaxID=3120821 RepID=A0AAU7DVD0_9MICO
MTESPTTLNPKTFDPHYPRPQLRRSHWLSLDGNWQFRQDPQDLGLTERWFDELSNTQSITVPFPPESTASGIADPSFDNQIIWYQKTLSMADLRALKDNPNDRILMHFGAIDYESQVWVNGQSAHKHEGGNTPFSVDISRFLGDGESVSITVRAQDDPLDVEKSRGKQDWLPQPHVIWYERTSGIWQSVWCEAVPNTFVVNLHSVTNVPAATVELEFLLNHRVSDPTAFNATISYGEELLAQGCVLVQGDRGKLTLEIDRQRNGQHYEHLLWSPEHPRLLTISVEFGADQITSYTGLRSVDYADGKFLLNDRPYYMRSVLNQGYRTESHLAHLNVDRMREEIQLIKDLGFNSARLHQKVEDPRLAFFADTMGLMLWVEAPSAYTTSTRAITRMLAEWPKVVDRFKSHPSVAVWVPINESWGVQHIAHDSKARHYCEALWHLTKSLDSTRLVVSNDGWELTNTDIWSIHDYEGNPEVLAARYATAEKVEELLSGVGPAGRRMRLSGVSSGPQPAMLTEFGGITYAPSSSHDTWGYSTASSPQEYEAHLRSVVSAVTAGKLAGFCYTQLRDTLQEANGLVDEAGVPKLPLETFREIFGGAVSR